MHNRLALFAASLAASGVLAAGLAFVGLSPAPVPAADSTVTAPVTDAPPAPITQIDTVYVAPQATPADIVVTKVVPATHHGDDGGGDD
jgi:hypothetical protein